MLKTYQFTVYLGANEIIIINLDEFKDLLILNKSKSHIQGKEEIAVESLVETKNLGFTFAIGKVNSENKNNAEELIRKTLK